MNNPSVGLAEIRAQILSLTRRYAERTALERPDFTPDETPVPPSGKTLGTEEFEFAVDAILDGWLTTGRFNANFEQKLAEYIGVTFALTTNSGSSANLLAISALCSPLLGKRAMHPGDEVITAAVSFPTTVNPILQNGLLPVFVDASLPTYNPKPAAIRAAISDKTRAIVLAHTLGNPLEIEEIRAIADEHKLWLVEDCCDALGSFYRSHKVGTFGHLATLSFYPAHHITTGEGGAVLTSDPLLKTAVTSLRDWGRACWCNPGTDNTCGKRFDGQWESLPQGYDHKYVYSHLGYNLKITDIQAAIGLAQLNRIDGFVRARKANFTQLHTALGRLTDRLILPEATPKSAPAWFGFPLTLQKDERFNRLDLLRHLGSHKIGVRLMFAGNITRQPYMQGRSYRVSGTLETADQIMNDSFWVGIHPSLSLKMLTHTAECIHTYFRR